jgi:hypothetical protein
MELLTRPGILKNSLAMGTGNSRAPTAAPLDIDLQALIGAIIASETSASTKSILVDRKGASAGRKEGA